MACLNVFKLCGHLIPWVNIASFLFFVWISGWQGLGPISVPLPQLKLSFVYPFFNVPIGLASSCSGRWGSCLEGFTCGVQERWWKTCTCQLLRLMGFSFNLFCCSKSGPCQSFFKVKELKGDQLDKIKDLSQGDLTNQERRMWYNAMNRRIGRGGLKPGLAEKFQSATGAQKFELLKASMADPDMFLGFMIYYINTIFIMYTVFLFGRAFPIQSSSLIRGLKHTSG